MNIRPAAPNDLTAWAEMRNLLWPDSIEAHRNELQRYFQGQQFDIDFAFMLTTENDQAIGFIEINLRSYAEGSQNSPIPYIEAWFVRPEYENKGGGKQLLEFAEHWAKTKGFSEIASDTELDNHRSIRLHKKYGFEETDRLVCFLKKL